MTRCENTVSTCPNCGSEPSVLPDPDAEPTISVERASELLGFSRDAVYEALRNGTFPVPVIKLGAQKVRIPTRPLLALLGKST